MAKGDAWVAQYLPELIRSGLSATAGLRAFRAPADAGGLGLKVSTTEWYRQWGQTINALAAREGFMAVNLARRPSPEQVTQFSSRKATGFLYTFDVLVRNNATGQTYYTPSGYRSATLVRFATAKQAALDAISKAAAEGSPSVSDLTVLGALPVEVREYLPGA
jgi:hypothetical protein